MKPNRHIFTLTHEVVKNFARMSDICNGGLDRDYNQRIPEAPTAERTV